MRRDSPCGRGARAGIVSSINGIEWPFAFSKREGCRFTGYTKEMKTLSMWREFVSVGSTAQMLPSSFCAFVAQVSNGLGVVERNTAWAIRVAGTETQMRADRFILASGLRSVSSPSHRAEHPCGDRSNGTSHRE